MKNVKEKYLNKKTNISIIDGSILIIIFLIIPFAWGDFLISIGDYFHIVFPAKEISSWVYSWDYQNPLGAPNPNNACAIFPFLSFLSFFEFLKFTPQLIERIWIIFILFSQFFSMYYLLNSVGIKSKNAKFVSSILYVINPVTIIFLITPPIAIGIALMPLTLGLLINGITKKSAVYFVFIVIVSFVSSYTAVNPSVFMAIWFPLIFYVVLNFSKIKKSHLFLLILGLLLVNIYWIFNVISIAGNVKFEHSTSWTGWTSANSSFLNMFRFQGFWAWNAKSFGSYCFPTKVFYENPIIIFISFCLACSAFLIFLNAQGLKKFQKSNVCIFGLLFLISIFIAKGLHEPLSFLNQFAYKHIPFFWIFRSPWEKFMPVAVFSMMVLFCYSIEFIEEKVIFIRRNKRKEDSPRAFKVILLLLIFLFGRPYFTGAMFPVDRGNFPGGRIKIPDYWYQASEIINNQLESGRILLLPENPFYQVHYFWPEDGYYGIDPTPHFIFKPLISKTPGGGFVETPHSSKFIELLYKEITKINNNSIVYLKMANVRYILHRNDLDWTHIGENKNSSIGEPERIKKIINELPFILEKSFGKIKSNMIKTDQYFRESILSAYPYMVDKTALDLYRIQDKYFLPHIYPASGITLVQSSGTTEGKSDIELLPDILSIEDENTRSGIFFSSQNEQRMESIKQVIKGYDFKERILITQEGSKGIYLSPDIRTPIIEFKKINPTKYRIRVHNATENFPLIFSESYHEGWKAYITKVQSSKFKVQSLEDYKILEGNESEFISKIIKGTIQNNNLPDGGFYETWGKARIPDDYHWVANGYANSWWISLDEIKKDGGYVQNKDGSIDFELVLEFWPQRLFYIGLFISGLTLISCVLYLMLHSKNRVIGSRSLSRAEEIASGTTSHRNDTVRNILLTIANKVRQSLNHLFIPFHLPPNKGLIIWGGIFSASLAFGIFQLIKSKTPGGESYWVTFSMIAFVVFYSYLFRKWRPWLEKKFPSLETYLPERLCAPYIAFAMLLLLFCALLLVFQLNPLAEQVANLVYFFLVWGVIKEAHSS